MRIAIHRRTDVAALGVDDAERTDLATGRNNLFENGNTTRAMPFEESRLGLESSDAPPECLDDAKGELSHTVCVVVKSPFLEEAGMRVDTHAHRSVCPHGGVEAIAEAERRCGFNDRRSHRVSSDRMESHSCRDRTE